MRSPIHGPTVELKTAGTPKPEEAVAVNKLGHVSEADLDVFLTARAQRQRGLDATRRGVFGAVEKLLSKPKPVESQAKAAHTLKQNIHSTLASLGAIYSDGFVSESEMGSLRAARNRLLGVMKLADPDVLQMLPRDVRERIEVLLLEPLGVITAAATRRNDRIFDEVMKRDEPALRQRLKAPVEYKALDVDVLARAGIPFDAAARYVPGDLVAVPRSDGSFSRGVVTANRGPSLSVEMLTADGQFAQKDITAQDLSAANPLKIGDTLETQQGRLWVSGSDDKGLYGFLDSPQGRVRIDADTMRRFASSLTSAKASTTQALSIFATLPGFSSCSQDTQRALISLGSLKRDPVFHKLFDHVVTTTKSPAFRALSPSAQAHQLTQMLGDKAFLPGVLPNIGQRRTNLSNVTWGTASWGDGAKLFYMPQGTPAPRAIVVPVTLKVGDVEKRFDVALPESLPEAKRNQVFLELTTSLQQLPPEVVSSLSTIVINPVRNPDDEWMAKHFHDPGFTSAMTANGDRRQIHVYPAASVSQAVQTFCHEAGHLVSVDVFGSINGIGPKWDAWEQARGADPVGVSQYGCKAKYEDFAEAFALYTSTKGTASHDAYRALMPHRFAILDEIAREALR
jgi:hypothetical protein